MVTELTNVKEEINKTLDELNDIYIRTRYPTDFEKVISELTKEKAEDTLAKTKEIIKWLKKQIKQQ